MISRSVLVRLYICSVLFFFIQSANLHATTVKALADHIDAGNIEKLKTDLADYTGHFQLETKETLLQLSIAKSSAEIAFLLIEAGADVNGPTKGFRKKSHLHLAIETGDTVLIETLLKAGADLNAGDKIGQIPLIYGVLREDIDAVELLIKYGANFSNNAESGTEALLAAIKSGKPKMIQRLYDMGASASTEQLAESQCSECHGMQGETGRNFAPHIAGQQVAYLQKQLIDYRSGDREYKLMNESLAGLTDDMIDDVAKYYANLPVYKINHVEDLGNPSNGKMLFENIRAGYPACTTCHSNSSENSVDENNPKVFGMNTVYLINQLTNFRSGIRANDATGIMKLVTSTLSDSDIGDLATYLSTSVR